MKEIMNVRDIEIGKTYTYCGKSTVSKCFYEATILDITKRLVIMKIKAGYIPRKFGNSIPYTFSFRIDDLGADDRIYKR